MLDWRLPGLLVACVTTLLSSQAKSDSDILNLEKDQRIASFKVENIYQNEAGRAVGARFRHIPSGFVLDLLRIQSVPQAFMWVNSFPPSDQGEPHTCEHLMLGKGTKGRYVGSLEEMYLGNSSAFTAQLQTCYHFHTAAGIEAFFTLMEAKLDALIHPNFSDEEIRREVCNVGYTINPVDSTIRLEEKGTVYNEMISGYERPWGNLGRELGHLLYGVGHPLANESGGYPDAIRTMIPDDMRRFIEKNYHLSNMGMIMSIGDEVDLEECLKRVSEILGRIEPEARPGTDPTTADQHLPAPLSAPHGVTRIVGFPSQNEKEPGLLVFAWSPALEFDNRQGYVLDLFMSNLAGGETSNLYRKFIDSQTRVMNLGANAVFEWVSSDQGHPVHIGFNNIRQEICNTTVVDTVRQEILEEIERISKLPDDSPELAAFNERARNRIVERRRDLRNFLNSPPGFGYRGTSGRWFDLFKHLQRESGFEKRLTLDGELAYAEELLASGRNFWREFISKWRLLENPPYAVVACPDVNLLRETERSRKHRIAGFVETLTAQYGTADKDEAISKFKNEYDARTRLIDSAAAEIDMPKFIDNPPLTLDDQLRYAVDRLPGGRQKVVSTFENMTSAMVGLAFRMDVVPESLLLYTAVLPTMLTEVGAIKDRRYSYDDMKEALRREIMELHAYYSVNARTQRVELVVRAEGGDLSESRRALEWLEAVLFSPDWSKENLARLRDAIDVALSDLRNNMRGPEEAWVDDPAQAFWRQDNPLMLSTSSFLTQAHAYQRMRWLLKDPGPQSSAVPFSRFMRTLAGFGAKTPRAEILELLLALQSTAAIGDTASGRARDLMALFLALPNESRALVIDAAEDLEQNLADIPDACLPGDWRYLCERIDSDLQVPPEKALNDMRAVIDLVRRADNVRVFIISNTQNRLALEPGFDRLLGRLSEETSTYQTYSRQRVVDERLRQREPSAAKPIYVGLVNDNTRSGVFINSAPCASFEDSDSDVLKKFLSARLFGGGGAHSMFMKTWGAGMAYSNGLRSNEFTGRLVYYAERCPDLAQTMQFVVNELRSAPRDPSLGEYAVAQAFSVYRSGSRYEARGEAMAADLADDLTPDKVRRFRQSILELRRDPNLPQTLYDIMEDTYGTVLPGYGPTADKIEDGVFFIIGPEAQFKSYENYLKSVEGDMPLYRLYPRDFWLVAPAAPSAETEPQ